MLIDYLLAGVPELYFGMLLPQAQRLTTTEPFILQTV